MNKPLNIPFGLKPVSEKLLENFHQLDNNQLQWLSGYCAGLAKAGNTDRSIDHSDEQLHSSENTSIETKLKTLILFGSQTGNSESIAKKLSDRLSPLAITLEFGSLSDFAPKDLAKWNTVLLIISTHGEGEPPDDAIEFYEVLNSKRAVKLKRHKHAVLALGDSSYEHFCQTGKDFDSKLTELGSRAIMECLQCDLDYEEAADNWINQLFDNLSETVAYQTSRSATDVTATLPQSLNVQKYDKNNPFLASIISNQKITGRNSSKTVHHIEISLEDSAINYLPGDGVGIWVKNNQKLITNILSLAKLSGEEFVDFKGRQKPLLQVLQDNLELTLLSKKTVIQYIEQVNKVSQSRANKLQAIIDNDFSTYAPQSQLIDILLLGRITLTAQALVDLLPPIKPRVYSIASSLEARPEQIDITVALVNHNNKNGERKGAASQFLIETLAEDDEALIYIEPNKHFKLPPDDKPIILVGPGTGIAPFRAFLQERVERSAQGDNWLFFGNPNFNTDFLYQTEWQKLIKKGVLTRFNVAFSRDQKGKIYVQNKMQQQAKEIWHWIDQQGAYFYLCGDMKRMAKDVHTTLLAIVGEQGNKTPEQADSYLKQLRKDGRYQRDVY